MNEFISNKIAPLGVLRVGLNMSNFLLVSGEDKLGLGKLLLNLSTVDVVNITTVNNTSVIELSPEVVDYELVFAQIFEKIF